MRTCSRYCHTQYLCEVISKLDDEVARVMTKMNIRTFVGSYVRTGQTLYPLHNFVMRGENKYTLMGNTSASFIVASLPNRSQLLNTRICSVGAFRELSISGTQKTGHKNIFKLVYKSMVVNPYISKFTLSTEFSSTHILYTPHYITTKTVQNWSKNKK